MDAVVATHVVLVVGIDEVIDLLASFDAGIDELDAVLPHNGVVFCSVDDEETAFKVFGLGGEGVVGIAFGVLVGHVHVALAVHDFVPFPIDDGTACATHFEDFWVGKLHGDSHEAAEAPTFHAHAVLIDIGERLKVFDAFHLVGHLDGAELAMGAALELEATVVGAAVIDGEDDVSLLGKVEEVEVAATEPVIRDQLAVWAAIDIDEGGILLALVHVGRGDEAIVEVGHAVGGLDGAHLDAGHGIVGQGVVELIERAEELAFLDVADLCATRVVDAAEHVDNGAAVVADDDAVGAVLGGEEGHSARGEVDLIGITASEAVLVGIDEDVLALGVEADEAFHLIRALGHLAEHLAICVVEIEVLVAVSHAEPEELLGVVGEEDHGVAGLNIARVLLLEEDGVELAILGRIAFKPHVVLLAVDFGNIDVFLRGVPADVGEVHLALGNALVTARVHIDDVVVGGVIDAECHLVALHAGHGVLEGLFAGDAGRGVDEGIVRDHGLVHAVEGQIAALGRPEGAFFDAELIAMDRLTEDDVLVGVFDGEDLVAVLDIEVGADGVGRLVAVLLHIEMLGLFISSNSAQGDEGLLGYVVLHNLAFFHEADFFRIDEGDLGRTAPAIFVNSSNSVVEGADDGGGLDLAGLTHIKDVILYIGNLVGVAHELKVSYRSLRIEATGHKLLAAEHLILRKNASR